MGKSMVVERWEIHPFEGIGPIRFGMARSQVRSILGNDFKVFKKGPFAANTTDAYGEHGLHFFYDTADQLECIDAFAKCPIYYRNVRLLNGPAGDILRELSELALSPREDEYGGLCFDSGGFVLSLSDDRVEAVTVYRKGYYDEALEGPLDTRGEDKRKEIAGP
jgi:hypothetical protein